MAPTSAAEASSAMEVSRNWLEVPDEVMSNILQRLGTKEILYSAWKVCTTWRRICKDPTMWKVIDIQKTYYTDIIYGDYTMLTKLAVDLSCGELIDLRIKGFGTDKLLDHILRCSLKLKRLSIMYSNDITGSGLGRAVKGRARHLEELELFHISNITSQDIEVIGRNCPQLRSLGIMVSGWSFPTVYNLEMFLRDVLAFAIAKNMPELRHLKLSDGKMTNDGLIAILNGCPRLQYLDVCDCDNLRLDGSLLFYGFKWRFVINSSIKLNRVFLWCRHDVVEQSKGYQNWRKLHLTSISINVKYIEGIGRNCPKLKSFETTNMMISGPFIDYNSL
ncbi:hypothetical protein LXL04_027563 [Taraxacum kok-saghyz]